MRREEKRDPTKLGFLSGDAKEKRPVWFVDCCAPVRQEWRSEDSEGSYRPARENIKTMLL